MTLPPAYPPKADLETRKQGSQESLKMQPRKANKDKRRPVYDRQAGGRVKKAALLFLAFFFFNASAFPQKVKTADLELFFECMDPKGWQMFFLADALRRRNSKVNLRVDCLVSKDSSGKWISKRGAAEIEESKRMAVISKYHKKNLLYYINARSLNPWRGGWIDAAVFAGINPDILASEVKNKGNEALKDFYSRAGKFSVSKTALLINGKEYKGEPKILFLMEAVNKVLPGTSKFKMYADRKTIIKVPKFWAITYKNAKKNDAVISTFKRYFSGIKPIVIDYSSKKAKKFDIDYAPAYMVEKNKDALSVFEPLIKAGVFKDKGKYLAYYDKNSPGVFLKKKAQKNTLEIFVMSQCPYGVQAENAIISAMDKKLLPKETKVKIRYILDAKKDGKSFDFKSLHGQPEWEENARQIYIAEKHSAKLFAYLKERNKDIRSKEWEKAAETAGLNPKEISGNFEKAKGFLYKDAKYTDSFQITTSPSFLVDGKYFAIGLNALKKIKGYEKISPKAANGACK